MSKVLISYSRTDGTRSSARIRAELQQAGHTVWRDIEEMRGGKDWKDQIRHAIAEVDVVILLLTPASVKSKHVLWECDTAKTLNTPLIGALIKPCRAPSELADLHYHDLSSDSKYMLGFANIIRDLNELVSQPTSEGSETEKPTESSFNFSGATINRGQFGHGNKMYNAPEDTSRLIQRIDHILKSQHQELRLMLLAELNCMNAEQKQQIEMILEHYQYGRIPLQDLSDFMNLMQALVKELRARSTAANKELAQIGQQLEQVYSGTLSQQHQFELTLPILPGIFQYRYSFGGAIDTDVRNLLDNLQQLWDGWVN